MLGSVTVAAPILLPLMTFGVVFYLLLRGGTPRRAATRRA